MILPIYIWNHNPETCNLKSTKIVKGERIQLDDIEYFIGNQSFTHLKIGPRERICDKEVFQTDFKDLYILDTENEQPIKTDISEDDISIFKDMSIRDKFLFKTLKDYIITTAINLKRQHCIDTKFSHIQFSTLHARIRSEEPRPFAIHSRSGNFIMALGESVYNFFCQKSLFSPVDIIWN